MADFMSTHFAPDVSVAHGGLPQKQAMDRMYRLQRHIYDLTRRHYLLGRDQLIANLNPPPGGTVLEIGCGTGRNLIKLAERYPDCRVFGFDISEEMLKSATSAIARRGLVSRIAVAEGDATIFDPLPAFGTAKFDRVCFSYTLSMIPDWPMALANARSMLAPGGELHAVDFGQCEGLPRWFRRGLFAWLRLFHVHPQPLLKQHFEVLAKWHGDSHSGQILAHGYSHYLRLTANAAPQKSP
jgi:S-adenosylmethionine-diacylgycerolhomoserine-N-methlytransferase